MSNAIGVSDNYDVLYFLSAGWAHVVCALYIPEVRFGNVTTMEPIILASVPHDRFCKVSVFSSSNTDRKSVV